MIFKFLSKNYTTDVDWANFDIEIDFNILAVNELYRFASGLYTLNNIVYTITDCVNNNIYNMFLSILQRKIDIFFSERYNLSLVASSKYILTDNVLYSNNKLIDNCSNYLLDVNGQTGITADGECLVDRNQRSGTFVADMGGVDAAVTGRDLGQGDNFVGA